jgi:hypothetical protein
MKSFAYHRATSLADAAVMDRIALRFGRPGAASNEEAGDRILRGTLGAGSLSAHSFLDGIAVGLAFQISPAIGAIVTAGVLTHDFSDGINTMSVVLKNGGGRARAMRKTDGFVKVLSEVPGMVRFIFEEPPEPKPEAKAIRPVPSKSPQAARRLMDESFTFAVISSIKPAWMLFGSQSASVKWFWVVLKGSCKAPPIPVSPPICTIPSWRPVPAPKNCNGSVPFTKEEAGPFVVN